MVTIRMCFFGDSITNGTGDQAMLGWPGRACAAAATQGHNVTLYNLGVRGHSSEDIRGRWLREAQARMPDGMNNHLIFSFGLNDGLVLDNGQFRVLPHRTLDNAEAILREAKAWLPTLFVGLAPVEDTRPPPGVPPGLVYRFNNDDLQDINRALASLTERLGVPYLDIFTSLMNDRRWATIVREGDAVHPSGAGYALIAKRVAGWPDWQALFSG